jgi:hypothetical protein
MDTLAAELWRIGSFHAAKQGLDPEDFLDCVAGFRAELFTFYSTPQGRNLLGGLVATQRRAFVHCCARRSVFRFVQAVRSRRRNQALWPYDTIEAGIDFLDCAETPAERAEHVAFWQLIRPALQCLPPTTERIVIARYVYEHSIAEIALAEVLSAAEVSLRLHRGRRHLMRHLLTQGVTAEALRADLLRRYTPCYVIPYIASCHPEVEPHNIGVSFGRS